mmetsp:Transcript_13480/g.31870  ORF Transcript_13480/g.31870 Transcript_13480/m.31870 type:complete len:227 (-) Transcript_13480:56-736(-)
MPLRTAATERRALGCASSSRRALASVCGGDAKPHATPACDCADTPIRPLGSERDVNPASHSGATARELPRTALPRPLPPSAPPLTRARVLDGGVASTAAACLGLWLGLCKVPAVVPVTGELGGRATRQLASALDTAGLRPALPMPAAIRAGGSGGGGCGTRAPLDNRRSERGGLAMPQLRSVLACANFQPSCSARHARALSFSPAALRVACLSSDANPRLSASSRQ